MQWVPKPGFLGANSDVQLIHCTGIGRLFSFSACAWGEDNYVLGPRVFLTVKIIVMCKVLIAISSVKQVLWKCYLCCYYPQILFSLGCSYRSNHLRSGSGNKQGGKNRWLFFLTKKNCFGYNEMQYSGNSLEYDFRWPRRSKSQLSLPHCMVLGKSISHGPFPGLRNENNNLYPSV